MKKSNNIISDWLEKYGNPEIEKQVEEEIKYINKIMKQLFRNSTHTQNKSHDCLIAEIEGKKIKVTYKAYNAVELCTTEFFDGNKWNHIFSMLDMGIEPETSAYNIWDKKERKKRADKLFKKAETMCNGIL